jgi:Flp pilus assembly protein TadB
MMRKRTAIIGKPKKMTDPKKRKEKSKSKTTMKKKMTTKMYLQRMEAIKLLMEQFRKEREKRNKRRAKARTIGFTFLGCLQILVPKRLGTISRKSVSAFYCIALRCTLLYCTVLHCTVLYCTVLYCTVLYCTVLHCFVLYCTMLYSIVLSCSGLITYSSSFLNL